MPENRSRRRTRAVPGILLSVLVSAAVAASGVTPANAVAGGVPGDASSAFVASIDLGFQADAAFQAGAHSCSGALIDPQWVLTSRSCFAAGEDLPTSGTPGTTATALLGATASGAGGQRIPIVRLISRPDRDVLLARLVTPATGITPVKVASTPAAVGDTLRLAGFGRTGTGWRPDNPQIASFDVTAVSPSTLQVAGSEASTCMGDAGGPAVRGTGDNQELVALHLSSGQGGCLGATGSARDAVETRVDDLSGWIRQSLADVAVYGTLADGHLTYSAIDSATGDRLTTVTSAQTLGFTPKALAVLNGTTLLVTSSTGLLYRVDITATNPELTFAAPTRLDDRGGWTHDLLAYDGDGSLFGIVTSTGALRRYTVTSAKPVMRNIIGNTLIGNGFTLTTLTTAGPDWILGTTSAGALLSYHITGDGGWAPQHVLKTTGWGSLRSLLSPGAGIYYARQTSGRMDRYRDTAPFDGSGADLQAFPGDPVDASGWTQTQVAAVPFAAFPDNPVDVSLFGTSPTGQLTYSAIDSATGDRLTTVTSAQTLGFTPKALTTLNANTLLVTDGNRLYRVDVLATMPALVFAPPVPLATGWTHYLLAFDGRGSLFGIANASNQYQLRRYTIGAAKPTAADITANTLIGGGFTLNTLTTTGPDWIMGTTAAGRLIGYHIRGAGDWGPAYTYAASGWAPAQLVSPGNGVIYAQNGGALNRYLDPAPFDGNGADIQAFADDPVDATGWTQTLLSAQPYIA